MMAVLREAQHEGSHPTEGVVLTGPWATPLREFSMNGWNGDDWWRRCLLSAVFQGWGGRIRLLARARKAVGFLMRTSSRICDGQRVSVDSRW
jgi:hypothetical protein